MPSGIVKIFFQEKGYGFIAPDDGSKDVFVHRRALGSGKSLTAYLISGDKVEYDVKWDDRKYNYVCSWCDPFHTTTATTVKIAMYRKDGRTRTKKKTLLPQDSALVKRRKADAAAGSKWETWPTECLIMGSGANNSSASTGGSDDQ
jgi:CspA family cold shock protein